MLFPSTMVDSLIPRLTLTFVALVQSNAWKYSYPERLTSHTSIKRNRPTTLFVLVFTIYPHFLPFILTWDHSYIRDHIRITGCVCMEDLTALLYNCRTWKILSIKFSWIGAPMHVHASIVFLKIAWVVAKLWWSDFWSVESSFIHSRQQ